MTATATQIPTQKELFDRLSHIAREMTATCANVETILSEANPDLMRAEDTFVLQDLDRMTQNLSDIATLLNRLSLANEPIERSAISEAIQSVILPSLKSYLQHGERQDDLGSVDLF